MSTPDQPSMPQQPNPNQQPVAPQAPSYNAAPPAYGNVPPSYNAAPAYNAAPSYGGPAYAGQMQNEKTNTLAIVSLVLAFVVSLGAIICGHIALSQIKKTGERGHGLALAGVIIGYVGFFAGLAYIIFVIAVFIGAASMGYSTY